VRYIPWTPPPPIYRPQSVSSPSPRKYATHRLLIYRNRLSTLVLHLKMVDDEHP
jgi:hypothetical protein